MKFRTMLAPALALSAMLATRAHAQNTLPVSFELRGGASIPTGDFADGVKTGWSLGGSVLYAPRPNLALYAGFQHDDFSLEDDADVDQGTDVGIQDNGLRAGARVSLLLAGLGSVRPWAEGGVLFNRTSVSASDGDVSASVDSNWKLGFEVGAGLTFDVSPKISITPGARFRKHSVDFGDVEDGATGDVSYVTVDLGINFHP